MPENKEFFAEMSSYDIQRKIGIKVWEAVVLPLNYARKRAFLTY
jgi:hypothetical protein